jgi:hypothetical protein
MTILLALFFTLPLPEQESIVYETNDRGKMGKIVIDSRHDSLGYHIVYVSDRVIEAVLDTLSLKTLYLKKVIGGKLNIEIFNDRSYRVFYKDREKKYSNHDPIFDRHTLDFVLRGFELGPQFKKRIRLSVPEFMVINADLETVGEDTVQTPAGTFECWKLRLVPRVIFTKMKFYFWIEKEYPHRFVRYRDSSGKNQILLIEYR